MTAQALLNASNRIAAKSQLAIKQGRKSNVVRLSQKRQQSQDKFGATKKFKVNIVKKVQIVPQNNVVANTT